MPATEIQGKTLGVIGLGAIGVMVANAAQSLNMNVVGYTALPITLHKLPLIFPTPSP